MLNSDPITETEPMPHPVPESKIDPSPTPDPLPDSRPPIEVSPTPRGPIIVPVRKRAVPVSPSQIHLERHFSCPKKYCQRECDLEHLPGHCRGFSLVFHECHHHCSPKFFDNSLLTCHLYKRIKFHTFCQKWKNI